MIRLLGDMPAGVLGLEAVDDVEKEDYENVIVPARSHSQSSTRRRPGRPPTETAGQRSRVASYQRA